MKIMLKGGVWKNIEDEILKAAVMKYGKNQWARIASLLSRKSAKQCKARWYEWLDPSIKKTEWSQEEREKLLHLVKIMPCQWRTIAPIIGRTATQCLEEYEKLLDQAAGKDEFTSVEARKLRPGEIDPTPETKAPKPDPVDMDEDEKEMIQEARARLANTKGKKAKRKAREKQLEEARRLAVLQKRRELKAAGIEINLTRRRGTMIDYNKEIPFQRKAAPGFYETSAKEHAAPKIEDVQQFSLKKMEGDRRDDKEKEARKKDAQKVKDRFEKNLPEALKQVSQVTEPEHIRKKMKMNLPTPQLTDQELETITKMGYTPDEDESNPATQSLLSTYAPSATPARTGGVANMTERTPMRQDTLMAEARSIMALSGSATPLVGGTNVNIDDLGDFSGVTPRRQVAQTPNPLLTPARSAMGLPGPAGSQTPGGLRGATPGRTPMRDSLSINEDDGTFFDQERNDRNKQRGTKDKLLSALSSLPAPKYEYNIMVPEVPEDDSGASGQSVADAADIERKKQLELDAIQQKKLRLRSQVLKRNLPRPMRINTDFAKDKATLDKTGATTEELITEQIKSEMVNLMIYEAIEFPPVNTKPAAAPKGFAFEQFEEDELSRADKLLSEEVERMKEAVGELSLEEFEQVWEKAYEDMTFLPDTKKFGLISQSSNNAKIAAEQYEFEQLKDVMLKENKKAITLEKKINVYHAGYQKKAQALRKSIVDLNEEIATIKLELDAFRELREQEKLAVTQRLEFWTQQVNEQVEQENKLQIRYANLLNERQIITQAQRV
jgi:pre-mRNA-splicing factor CDC5/CEF1